MRCISNGEIFFIPRNYDVHTGSYYLVLDRGFQGCESKNVRRFSQGCPHVLAAEGIESERGD